jgi:hypothetical protein
VSVPTPSACTPAPHVSPRSPQRITTEARALTFGFVVELRGVEQSRANQIAKWLNVPYESGFALVREPARLGAAFGMPGRRTSRARTTLVAATGCWARSPRGGLGPCRFGPRSPPMAALATGRWWSGIAT